MNDPVTAEKLALYQEIFAFVDQAMRTFEGAGEIAVRAAVRPCPCIAALA